MHAASIMWKVVSMTQFWWKELTGMIERSNIGFSHFHFESNSICSNIFDKNEYF